MECLRQDLASENIGVSVLCPAAVNTNIFDHATMRPGLVAGAAVPERDGLDPEIAKRLLAQGRSPLEVGDMVREAILRNDPYIFTDRRVQADLAARRDALFAAASA
jgi:NAD(P)-dependent dehydrogenase (short-subunit alcohol dehydrogenase family)